MSKIRSLFTDFMSLPLLIIAAMNGRATCSGVILTTHDYILMSKDNGYFYLDYNNILKVPTTPYIGATIRAKILSPAIWHDLILKQR